MPSYLDGLNPQQKQAATTTEGPLLILAGAGAGKTKTVTHRILHLIHQGVPASQILAITFTNKAAKEMRERVEGLIAGDQSLNTPIATTETPFVSTFHALGVHILRENSRKLNIPRHFTIFDRQDAKRAIKEAVEKAGYNPKEYAPQKMLGLISRQKGRDVTVRRFRELMGDEYMDTVVADIWERYEEICENEKALDFDDLLLKTSQLLKHDEEVRTHYQRIWRYIHIDEYQDTNVVQNEIAKLLTGNEHNICVVGDIDQNIYSWRGAQLKNILDFEETFPSAQTVVLEENYRSTQTILEAANAIIEKNEHRKEKRLVTQNGAGEPIALYNAPTERDEARFIAHTCRDLLRDGVDPNEIAVLYRANFQSRVIEEAFLKSNVPYQILGTRFFDRKEVKDVLAFIRAALNADSWGDIKRVINVPPRGIGKVTLMRIIEGKEDGLAPAMQKRVAQFRDLLRRIRDAACELPPSQLVKFVIKETGIETALQADGDEGAEKLENIRELATLAAKYDEFPTPRKQETKHNTNADEPETDDLFESASEETSTEGGTGIDKLLEDAALATDQDNLNKNQDAVKLMTVHAAKGLEFEHVFITGLEDELFPHRKLDEESLSPEEAEEERRLFYVALTRAKKKLHLTYAAVRTVFGSQQMNLPSEFLTDMDENLLEVVGEDDVNQGGGGLLGWPGDEPMQSIRF